ncbi:MAG: hypothetical protein GY798_20380 [Hyphomicrobiales bacterium]|nr:hypothetical protein [Hyphomicrobiales bacterium]
MAEPRPEKVRMVQESEARLVAESQEAEDTAIIHKAMLDKFAADNRTDPTLSDDVKAAIDRRLGR